MLNQFTMLKSLPQDELKQVEKLMGVRNYDSKQVIFRQGQVGDEIFFIAEGRVCISTTNTDGRELLITYLFAGHLFGELSLLTGNPRSADAISASPTKMYVLSREDFNQCLKLPIFAKSMLTYLAQRLSESSSRFSDLVLYNINHNVLCTLKSLAEPSFYDGKRCLIIEERPTHQEIAALVGSSREVITRTLKDLQTGDKILMKGRKVIIFDSY